MGALMNGFGSAGQAAAASLVWGGVGTGISAVGDISSAAGQAQQYNYMAQVAANNAQIMRSNQDAAASAGSFQESSAKLQTGQTVGAQRAAQSADGIDVNVGSPAAVRDSTENLGALDAALLHYNTARQVLGLQTEEQNYTAQSELDKRAAKNSLLAGAAKAASTIISGASSLSGKAAAYKLNFPAPASGPQ